MERKFMIAEFAALVGTTSKTIYDKIRKFDELPVNEQLITVKEKVKGREVALIVTNTDQINYFKNLYGKNNVTNGEYYETLTENNGYKQVENLNEPVKHLQEKLKTSNNNDFDVDIWNQFITVNNNFNERYEQKISELIAVNNELAEVKGRQLLLEDKAGREGLYINEINQLKTDNEAVKKFNERLKYVIITLIMVIIGFIMYLVMVNNVSQPVNNVSETVTNVQEQAATPQVTQPVKNVSNQRKR